MSLTSSLWFAKPAGLSGPDVTASRCHSNPFDDQLRTEVHDNDEGAGFDEGLHLLMEPLPSEPLQP